ncbi:hypothetical protein Tco_0103939 [Tanacetum coccineum]
MVNFQTRYTRFRRSVINKKTTSKPKDEQKVVHDEFESNTLNVRAASTPTGANAGESSFVYLGGKILIDASTLPNADLPINPNMPDLEDVIDTLPNDENSMTYR